MTVRCRLGALVVGLSLAASAGCVSDPGPEAGAEARPPDPLALTEVAEQAPMGRAVGRVGPDDRLRRFTLLAAGDILIHQAVWESARGYAGGEGFDFWPVFEPVAGYIAGADLALCHLEVPLSPDNSRLASYPRFVAPYELAEGIAAAGFDGCSVASNHILDQGVEGIDATLGHLDRVGVGHAGAARSPLEAVTVTTYDVRGISVAHLSYTYGFNGLRRPDGEEWRADLISVPAILDTAARARRDGADAVVVSLHWGDEYVHRPNRFQHDVAAAVAPSPDIDLVIGHHPHVLQPAAEVGGTPVLYSLGNLVSNMLQAERRDGVLVVATFEAAPGGSFLVTDLAALPTQVELPGHRIVPAPADSWSRTWGHLEALGQPMTPLSVPEVPQ